MPIVGNKVIIGTGSKLLGQIKIGDGVMIGANSVVLTSFERNSIIAGAPAKLKKSRINTL